MRAKTQVVLRINERWRLVSDDLQWILEYRQRSDETAHRAWLARKYIITRMHLIKRVTELCGAITPEVAAGLHHLPEVHPGYAAYAHTDRVQEVVPQPVVYAKKPKAKTYRLPLPAPGKYIGADLSLPDDPLDIPAFLDRR